MRSNSFVSILTAALFAGAMAAQEPGVAESDAADLAAAQAEMAELRDRWTGESDPERRRQLGQELADLAIKVSAFQTGGGGDGQPEQLVIEVATDGQFAQRQIATPSTPKKVRLYPLRTLPGDLEHPWVIRRMTRDRLEVWLSRHGWLFDGKGRLLAEATPPRRDGVGREWFGAFLPDGRWVTTDLFAEDKTLTFFTRAGKWLKEISANTLVPAKSDDDPYSLPTIGWCRCTRDGDAFVLSVGQNGGRGEAVVNWNGDHHSLGAEANPWQLCYPRDLEPKGTYTHLSVPDDRGAATMTREEFSHGIYVGYPVYEAGKVHVRVPDGGTFGFWPGSKKVYVVVRHDEWTPDGAGGMREQPAKFETWFYDEDGKFAGWIAAKRIADTADREGMLFVDAKQTVTSLTSDRQIGNVEQFSWNDGAAAEPVKLFPDLRLGCFQRGEKLVLARW